MNKMAKKKKVHIYQQLKVKTKISKQEEPSQNHGYGDSFDGCQIGGGVEECVKN